MAFKDDLQRSIDALDRAVFEDGEAPKDGLEEATNVVKLSLERILRKPETLRAEDVTPQDLVALLAAEIEADADVKSCYTTLIAERDDSFHVSNYRANLNRVEEIAYRLLGLLEAVENWRADR